ncbi:MAG: ABC transporter substrate-binding protein [Syntrophomonadaceae bacterium]|nr:ABC transporter substrate-binding protein [Syntrophomonadaceae bacterium]
MRVPLGKYRIMFILLMILVLSALTGRWLHNSDLLKKHNDVFRYGLVETVATLDPARMNQRGERIIGLNLYEGLVALDVDTLEPLPALAVSWQISEDARVFTFQLRPRVRFHTGRPLTAMDVKSSWERVLDLGPRASAYHLLLPIKGTPEKVAGKTAEVAGIEVLNERELRVTLERPDVSFLSRLSMPPFWVLDVKFVQAQGDQFGLPGCASAGTGPFILREWDRDQTVSLAINRIYWGQKPTLHQYKFFLTDPLTGLDLLREGRLDYIDGLPVQEHQQFLLDSPSAQVTETKLLNNYFYQFNLADPYWGKSRLLRQALNYALNRQALIDRLFKGEAQPMESFLPAGFLGYQPNPFPYEHDQNKAQQLLVAAGYPQGKGLPPLELAYNDLESHQIVAREVKRQLNEIGIAVKLRPVSWPVYCEGLEAGKFTCFRSGWSWEYADPDDFFYANFHSSRLGLSNFSFYQNPQVDYWLDAARSETKDNNKRMQLYRQIEKQVMEDAPLLWLFSWQRLGLASPRVHNLKCTPLDLVFLHEVRFTP